MKLLILTSILFLAACGQPNNFTPETVVINVPTPIPQSQPTATPTPPPVPTATPVPIPTATPAPTPIPPWVNLNCVPNGQGVVCNGANIIGDGEFLDFSQFIGGDPNTSIESIVIQNNVDQGQTFPGFPNATCVQTHKNTELCTCVTVTFFNSLVHATSRDVFCGNAVDPTTNFFEYL